MKTTADFTGRSHLYAEEISEYLAANGVPDAGVFIARNGAVEVEAGVDCAGLLASSQLDIFQSNRKVKATKKASLASFKDKQGDLSVKELSDIVKALLA